MLGGQPLEQRVGVRGEPHLERPALRVLAHPVEDDDAARAAHGDIARKGVDQLPRLCERSGVEQVVAVEEIELSHAGGELRTAAARLRPTR